MSDHSTIRGVDLTKGDRIWLPEIRVNGVVLRHRMAVEVTKVVSFMTYPAHLTVTTQWAGKGCFVFYVLDGIETYDVVNDAHLRQFSLCLD